MRIALVSIVDREVPKLSRLVPRSLTGSPAARWIFAAGFFGLVDAAFQVCFIRLVTYTFPMALIFAISMVASLAIFLTGLGALLSRRLRRYPRALLVGVALSIPLSLALLNAMHLVITNIFILGLTAEIAFELVTYLLVILLPFVLFGAAIGVFYLRTIEADRPAVRWLVSLSAAGFFLGYAGSALVLTHVGVWNIILLISLLAAMCRSGGRLLAIVAAGCVALLATLDPGSYIFSALQKPPWLWTAPNPGQVHVYGRWSPYARIDFWELGDGRLGGLYDGMQFWSTGDPKLDEPARQVIYSGIRGKVLVIGSGGGHGLLQLVNADRITAVELDPGVVAALQGPLADYVYDIYNRIHAVHAGDGRAFLETTDETYDAIIFEAAEVNASMNIRSFIQMENYLYTVEGIKAALDRLEPEGVIYLTHTGGMLPLRRIIKGIPSEFHWAVWETDLTVFDPEIYPNGGVPSPVDGKKYKLTAVTTPISRSKETIQRVEESILKSGLEIRMLSDSDDFLEAVRKADAITDDRPLLYLAEGELALPFVVPTVLLLVGLGLICLLRRNCRLSLYFVLIRVGFAITYLYVVITARSLLGGYVETSSVVLGALLMAYAIGTLYHMRFDRKRLFVSVVVAFAILFLSMNNLPTGAPTILKVLFIIVALSPAGFVMGVFFPKGFVLSEQGKAAFYYAIDTLGAALGFLLFYLAILAAGFDGVMLLAVITYLGAAALLR